MANSATYNRTKVHFAEGSAAATPDAAEVVIYAKADGLMYSKDDAGVETAMGAGVETLPESIIDAAGDTIIGDGADSAVRLARGTDGQVYKSTATTVAWEDDFYIISYVMDGGGAAISTGVKPPIEVPMAGAIVASRTLLDQSATFTMDWWKDTYANYPPLDADSITASAQPGTAAAIKDEDTTLTGWTTTVAAGDILIPNVDANDTAEWAVCILKVKKT